MAPQPPSSLEEQEGELDEPESEGAKQGPGPPSDRDRPATCDAPDGGWGWVVLVATILVLALTLAFPSCIGIFYLDLQEEFKASNSETSWVPSIMTSVLHAGGKNVIVSFCLEGAQQFVISSNTKQNYKNNDFQTFAH